MTINTEIPISKVTFDDQEISLAKSGGGGEMKQETYAGTDLATLCSRACELFVSGKLLSMDIVFTSTSAYNASLNTQYITYDLTNNSATYSKNTYQYVNGNIMRCVPRMKQPEYTTMFFDASYGKITRSVYIRDVELSVSESYFTYNTTDKKINFYDKTYIIDKAHFTATLNYLA